MEEPIKIERVEIPKIYLYNSKGERLGFLFNEHELNKVRVQICELDLEGYYIMWWDKKIHITKNGKLSEWPEGLYDQQEKGLAALFKAQKIKGELLAKSSTEREKVLSYLIIEFEKICKGKVEIDEDSRIAEWLDSLDTVELAMTIERTINNSIPDEELLNWKTVSDIIDSYLKNLK